MAQGFNVADIYLNRTYLESFSAAPIVPAPKSLMDTSNMREKEFNMESFVQGIEKFIDTLSGKTYTAIQYREIFGYIPAPNEYKCSQEEFFDALIKAIETRTELSVLVAKKNMDYQDNSRR